VPLGGGGEGLGTAVNDLDWLAGLQREQGDDTLAGDIGLAAKTTAHHGRKNAHPFHRQAHGLGHRPAIQVRVLSG
jgi:hypothetical protein